jgi:hypothetical protein
MILVTDIITKVETTYDSLAQASRALNSTAGNITRYFTRDQKTPYKKRYIKKILFAVSEKPVKVDKS